MSNVGPVCHIPPVNTPGNPQPLNIPGIPGPANPNDPNSIANLLNALRLALLALLNQLNHNNTQNSGGSNNFVTKPSPTKNSAWAEVKRVTEKVRVFQNNDPTSQNYVDVEQINGLTMQNKKSGEQWVWKR